MNYEVALVIQVATGIVACAIWWRRMNPSEEWNAEWELVPDVDTPVDSGGTT